MQITGKQLLFLIQVLQDTMKLPIGTDWVFKSKSEERKKFYDLLIAYIISSQEKIEIEEIDLSKLEFN